MVGGKRRLWEAGNWAQVARRIVVPANAWARRDGCPLSLAVLAHNALGNHLVDITVGIAELGQHLAGVLAEFGRGAAQARFGAVKPDRGSDALVPILLDDVAAVDRVRIGQRLVDLLHRPFWNARGAQSDAERLGLMLGKYGAQLRAQRLAVADTVLVARKARIGAELRLADFLG